MPPSPSDPEQPKGWAAAKLIALTELAAAEAKLFSRLWDLLKEWGAKLHGAVFGHHHVAPGAGVRPDPLGVYTTTDWLNDQLTPVLDDIEEIWTDGYAGIPEAPEMIPDAQWGSRQAIAAARNRLVRVPDSVYRHINGATLKATTEGWSMPDLALEVEKLLGEHGQESWRNRAMTIARTEALSAYNGGKFASFTSIARSVPGDWEKQWLATHDHRTRFTHTKKGGGDGQRVPLFEAFQLGEARAPMMFPGDPAGPAHETINCRCSMLLLERGETPDLSDRHYRSAR